MFRPFLTVGEKQNYCKAASRYSWTVVKVYNGRKLPYKVIDLFRLRETIYMNMQIRRDVILDTLMAAVNVLRQWKMNQFQSWRANKRCRLCAI